jgi:hypothetical protein
MQAAHDYVKVNSPTDLSPQGVMQVGTLVICICSSLSPLHLRSGGLLVCAVQSKSGQAAYEKVQQANIIGSTTACVGAPSP